MSASINMIVVKHFKQEVGRSVLDLCLDKELPNLLAILPMDLEKCFYPKFGDKNLFRSESDQTESLLLDVMKHLRLNKWNLLTSNSFAHLSLEKTVESHFYFEKIIKSTAGSSISTEDGEIIDDEKMKSFKAFLRHQFNEYENAKARDVVRSQFSYDTDQQISPQPKYSSPMASSRRPNSIPPEVVALSFGENSQQSGPYAFAKRASAAGASPPRRSFAPEVMENFSKAQQQIAEAEAEELQRQQEQQRLLQQQVARKASLPPLPPSEPEKKAITQNPAVSNRLVQKYQPIRKSIAGISPKLEIQPGDVDQETDMSNFYEAKHDIAELNPLHGSTPRSNTPVPSVSENLSIEATVPVLSSETAPSPVITPTSTISPVPTATTEPSLARQPSAADKLLSKYRRKSSFSLNKSTNNGIASVTTAAQVEDAVNNASSPKQLEISPQPEKSPIAADGGSATPTKRVSLFALQNGSSSKAPVEVTAVSEPLCVPVSATAVSAEATSVFPSVDATDETLATSTVSVPKPSLQATELSIDTEKPVVEESSKKSPSITPTSAGTSKSFLSRYQPKKRSIAGNSSNNLRAELQQANVLPASNTEQNQEEVTVSATSVEVSSEPVTLPSPVQLPSPSLPSTTIPPVSISPSSSSVKTMEDILQSLPEIPSVSHLDQTESSSVRSTAVDLSHPMSSKPHIPPPPAAETVIAILEAQTASPPPATTHSLLNDIELKTPFTVMPADDAPYDNISTNTPTLEYKREENLKPTPSQIPVIPVAFEALTTEAAVASVSSNSLSSATAAAVEEGHVAASAHPDDIEVAYAEKTHIANSSTLMRQLAAAKSAEADPELQQHESEKTNHYAKLGSAFVTNNVLGRGGRGAGRGRGRGF